MLLKVNFFAADKGKSFICRAFIKLEMILLSMYAEFHRIYCQLIFYNSSLIQFLFVKVL